MFRASIILSLVAIANTANGFPGFFLFAPTSYTPHPAVVRVIAPEKDGTSYGSGTLVAVTESTGLVLTNWHVVRDAAGPITVVFPDGFRSPASVLRTDRDWDLAALVIYRPRVAPMPLASVAPRPGDTLTIAGYGSGSYRAITGQCTQYVSPGGNHPFEMVELDVPARNGDSGGPIINERGELAGVLFGSAFGRTTGSYCGRLRWFLTPIEGDFRRISAQTMLAQQAANQTAPAVAIPNNASVQPQFSQAVTSGVAPLSTPQTPQVTQSPPPNGRSTLPAVSHDENQPLKSPSPTVPPSSSANDQIKNVLATIGAIAVLYMSLKLLGRAIG